MARIAAPAGSCLVAAVVVACSPSSAGLDASPPCTLPSCEAECGEAGLAYGSCAGGRCNCHDASGADDGDAADRWWSDIGDCSGRDDGDEGGDGPDGAGVPACIWVPVETRPGASSGVTCTRISVPEVEVGLLAFDGHGAYITFSGRPGRPRPLWIYDRRSRCLRILDDLQEMAYADAAPGESSVDGDYVAYVVAAGTDPYTDQHVYQIRLARTFPAEPRLLVETRSMWIDGSHHALMDSLTLRYPWVTWRDVREAHRYHWSAFAFNIETGEERNLSVDPETGENWDTATVDADDRLVVFQGRFLTPGDLYHDNVVSVDLVTGARVRVAPSPMQQIWSTVTPEWIVWLAWDLYPGTACVSDVLGCFADIYGLDRATGEVRALVVAGDSMQGPWIDAEGDWVLYEDQRDGTDVTRSLDREEDMYAFHLPTMTEVRVTDWPGFEMYPKVYDRLDGTFGALFIEEIDYGSATYRLWDCDLPAPP